MRIGLDLHDGAVGVDDAEVDDGVDAGGHVVAGDHVLRRDVQRDRAQRHAHHAVDRGGEQHEARALHGDHPAEPEDDRPLVLAQHPHRRRGERERSPPAARPARSGRLRSRCHLPFLRRADGQRQSVDVLDHDRAARATSGGSPSRPQVRARQSPPSTNTQSSPRATPTRPIKRVGRAQPTGRERLADHVPHRRRRRRRPRSGRRGSPPARRFRPRRRAARRPSASATTAPEPSTPWLGTWASAAARAAPTSTSKKAECEHVFLLTSRLLLARARGNVIMPGRNGAP